MSSGRLPRVLPATNRARFALQGLLWLVIVTATVNVRAQGLFIPSVGPINQSMGGATVAAPIDAIGSLAWNPGAISGIPRSEVAFGLGLVLPATSLSSEITGLAAGTTDSEPGAAAVPTFGLVHHCEDSAWTFGIGVFGVGG